MGGVNERCGDGLRGEAVFELRRARAAARRAAPPGAGTCVTDSYTCSMWLRSASCGARLLQPVRPPGQRQAAAAAPRVRGPAGGVGRGDAVGADAPKTCWCRCCASCAGHTPEKTWRRWWRRCSAAALASARTTTWRRSRSGGACSSFGCATNCRWCSTVPVVQYSADGAVGRCEQLGLRVCVRG